MTIVVEQKCLGRAVDHLRQVGGAEITVSPPNYFFEEKSWNYEALVEKLKRQRL